LRLPVRPTSLRPVPTVTLEASAAGREKTVEAPEGGPLVDLCDEYLLPVPFSCRSASCATCQVEVIEGKELLEEPNEDEAELLDILGAPENVRLACQAGIKPRPGRLRLRAVE